MFTDLYAACLVLLLLAVWVGADLVMRDPAAARIAELERELKALKRVA